MTNTELEIKKRETSKRLKRILKRHEIGRRKKERFKRYQGARTDTKPVDIHTTRGGVEYVERLNAPLYPVLTTIPVSQPTKKTYAVLRRIGKYNNYDELLIDLIEGKIRLEELKTSRLFDELDTWIARSKQAIRSRKMSRKRAFDKGKYRPR